nr:MAG TPA: hypothetical protein [Bacteriophage sp.]
MRNFRLVSTLTLGIRSIVSTSKRASEPCG